MTAAVARDFDLLASLEDRVERLEHAALVAQRYARLVDVLGTISAREGQLLGSRPGSSSSATTDAAAAATTTSSGAMDEGMTGDDATAAAPTRRDVAVEHQLDQLDTTRLISPRLPATGAATADGLAEPDLSWIAATARAGPSTTIVPAMTAPSSTSATEAGLSAEDRPDSQSTTNGSSPYVLSSGRPHPTVASFVALAARTPRLSSTIALFNAGDAVSALSRIVATERALQSHARIDSMRCIARYYSNIVAPLNEVVVRRNASMKLGQRPKMATDATDSINATEAAAADGDNGIGEDGADEVAAAS